MHFADKEITEALPYACLVEALDLSFRDHTVVTPPRHHHDFPNPAEAVDSTLLLMPCWQAGTYLGLKLVTISPHNSKYQLPTIQGLYLLFNAHNGQLLATMEAKTLTNIRTAATSALAARYLAHNQASTLLMVGNGALARFLIDAHTTLLPIQKVMVWGRNLEKSKALAAAYAHSPFVVQAVSDLDAALPCADIVSCATLSKQPLLKGNLLKPGAHLDLVGAYKKDMREADDDCVRRCSIFLDVMESGLRESGDIAIPLSSGVLNPQHIKGDLFDLCSGRIPGRTSAQEITFFKSVGHAQEDLVAAVMVWERVTGKNPTL